MLSAEEIHQLETELRAVKQELTRLHQAIQDAFAIRGESSESILRRVARELVAFRHREVKAKPIPVRGRAKKPRR